MRRSSSRTSRAFTLIEVTAVITIMAILAIGVSVFLRLPLQAYQDAQRRASMSDAADTAFTMLKRDLQRALPNSVRVRSVGAAYYLEFLQVRTGGRYRADEPNPRAPAGGNTCPDADGDTFANENVLQFGIADTCLATLGAVQGLTSIIPNRDFLVVYNLGLGFPAADAYASGAGSNRSLITAVAAGAAGENVIAFQGHAFTLESPARRFHVISGPVTYACDPVAGVVRRYAAYAIAAAQPAPPAGAFSLLTDGIDACSITYDQNPANQRTGVVSVWLRFADPAGGAAVSLFQQVQVSNEP